jgi:hypothetical protein
MSDFGNIDYLRKGTHRQKKAYKALTNLGIMDTLAKYDARLAGTIPLDVDIPDSDLDILCKVTNEEFAEFATLLEVRYGYLPGFTLSHKQRYGHPVVICDFNYCDFPIQIYASPTPVEMQRAWMHMLAEAHLLARATAKEREAIRILKLEGTKTEPAFAQIFGLEGDPYEILYELGKRVGMQTD